MGIKRRELIKTAALLSAGMGAAAKVFSQPEKHEPSTAAKDDRKDKPVFTVAHITDVHITDGNGVPERFKKCLGHIVQTHQPDFFLNGGDAVMDVSYDNVPREQVTRLWKTWDDCIQGAVPKHEIYSCIGNHDCWWKAPSTDDSMYGKAYAASRLKIPARYYSFTKKNWHFVILDGNNKDISLDEEQMLWLKKDLAGLPAGHFAVVMSHFPILGITPILVGGGHADKKELKDLFYQHRDKVRICLSGHNHLMDNTIYNDVKYCCNGAVSGFWWGKGDGESKGNGFYLETPPGYAILKLYADGRVDNDYYPHEF
ncbi:metallophosphoesterase family protein [Flavihumibacter petaseus]|uniref:Putative phosphatase n=1 Tax=Flavihumibacter petaseus NBRC 106054 TaxID=1220578 RepID=A0A0E9N005_9BACT|nr:metallophosphoesterase [Flavihumibacter petaseus]GAO42710.1 putative phosphatase [Flavihumibacter petaseus NBRC 106054]